MNTTAQTVDEIDMDKASELLDISKRKLFSVLRSNGVFMRNGNGDNIATPKHVTLGYFRNEQKSAEKRPRNFEHSHQRPILRYYEKPVITNSGMEFVRSLLIKENLTHIEGANDE